MRPWAQFISLGLSIVGLALALRPRDYNEQHTGAESFRLIMWPKLFRFPIFWIGGALLALVTVQGLNPSWMYVTDGKGWWMQQVDHITWLPSGMDVPFERWGPWRMLMIYGSVWLTVCTVWIAFTRRRTIQWLAIVIAINGVVLAGLGIAQRFLPSRQMFWFWNPPPRAHFFSSFIYKNHAGAYLLLALVVTCGLAAWYYYRGIRRLEKSNPAGIFAFMATCIAISMVVSYARGSTLTMFAFITLSLTAFIVHQIFFAKEGTRRPVVVIVMLVMFTVFVANGYQALRFGESWKKISRGLADGGDTSFKSRMVANRASTEMLRDHWKLGIGAGGFPFLFPAYQQHHPEIFYFPGGKRRQYWSHAHNDVLQIPMELGLTGMFLVAAAWLYWIVSLLKYYFWSKPLSLVVVFGAMLFVGYSYFDFPFYCPAVLMLWCVLWPIATRWAALEERSGRA